MLDWLIGSDSQGESSLPDKPYEVEVVNRQWLRITDKETGESREVFAENVGRSWQVTRNGYCYGFFGVLKKIISYDNNRFD